MLYSSGLPKPLLSPLLSLALKHSAGEGGGLVINMRAFVLWTTTLATFRLESTMFFEVCELEIRRISM